MLVVVVVVAVTATAVATVIVVATVIAVVTGIDLLRALSCVSIHPLPPRRKSLFAHLSIPPVVNVHVD